MSSTTASLSSEDLRSARQELRSKLQGIETRLKQTYVPPHFRITTSSTNNQRTFSTNGHPSSTDSTPNAKRSRISSSSYDEHYTSLPENNFDDSSISSSSKSLHSSIVPTNKIIRTKDDLISLVNRDQQSTGRNRRMFGVLLGTLNKFKAEANAYNEQTLGIKRQEIERRLEEKQEKEREDKKHERTELLATKKDCQQQLKLVNIKLEIIQRMATYDKNHLPLRNFIRTKTKPYIFYLPKGPIDSVFEKKLQESQLEIDKEMEEFKRDSQQKLDSLDESINMNHDDDDDEIEVGNNKKRKLNEHDDTDNDEDEGDTLADLPDEITLSAPEVKSEIVNTTTSTTNSNVEQSHSSTTVPKTTRTVIYDETETTNKEDDQSMIDE